MFMLNRLVSALVLMLFVSFLSFVVLMMLPGDPVELMLGMEAPPDVAAELRHQLGLDLPWYVQYGNWLFNLLRGDMGESLTQNGPVWQLIIDRLPLTLSVAFFSIMITLALAIPLGLLAGIKKGSWIDGVIQAFVQLGLAVPSFWIAILFILVFAVMIPIFPPSGYVPLSDGFWPHMKSLLLPSLSMAIVEAAVLIRMIRASLLDVLNQDYMTFAKTKGLSAFHRYIHYALRNSLIGPITLLGLQVMNLISGVIIIENIFALPGLGRLLFVAVGQRDLILVQGLVIFFVFTVIVINLFIDGLYAKLDPRIKLDGGRKF